MYNIIIVSDTHDNQDAISHFKSTIAQLDYDLILHCGDMTSPATLELFSGLPLEAVYGNCDYNRENLNIMAKQMSISKIEHIKEITMADKKICFMHGDNQATLSHAIYSGNFDYIFHGHTHERKDITIENTRVINPGALYRAAEYSFAYLNLESGELTTHFIDNE